MAYNEEKDLIQNMKDIEERINAAMTQFSVVQPSIDEILSLREQFENLATSTVGVVKLYETTLVNKNNEYADLLLRCKSQFKQVTNDIESLVNLEVNFTDIKDKILECLELSEHMANLVKGPFVLMKAGQYIHPDDRIPYKHYLKVIDSLNIGTSTGDTTTTGRYIISPTLGISYDAK